MLRNAHGGDISCLTFSKDGYTLLTRAQDDTVKGMCLPPSPRYYRLGFCVRLLLLTLTLST
jgi:hypothetical protein